MVVCLMRILMCFMAQEANEISLNNILYPVVIIFYSINWDRDANVYHLYDNITLFYLMYIFITFRLITNHLRIHNQHQFKCDLSSYLWRSHWQEKIPITPTEEAFQAWRIRNKKWTHQHSSYFLDQCISFEFLSEKRTMI